MGAHWVDLFSPEFFPAGPLQALLSLALMTEWQLFRAHRLSELLNYKAEKTVGDTAAGSISEEWIFPDQLQDFLFGATQRIIYLFVYLVLNFKK